MSASTKIQVCLIDDDPDVRNAIRLLLKSEGLPLTSYANAQDFLDDLDQQKQIGCLLLDIRLGGMSGLELLRILHERKIPIPTIILTGHASTPTTVSAMKIGALDVIEKPFRDDELLSAVRRALNLYEKWRKNLQERHAAATKIAGLTPREKQVLELMTQGLPNREIAIVMGISPKTLDIHRANVIDKMEARTTADLVRAHLLETADPLMLPYLFTEGRGETSSVS